MSGSNQFLPFATGAGSNTLTPSAYAALTPLLNLGFQSGVAQSIQFNTVLRQASFVASGVGQFIANEGFNANDDGNQASFVSSLISAILASTASAYITPAAVGATYAPIASPALTGNPTAPTQSPGDSTTKVSTTAFVATAITASLVAAASAAAATQIGIGQTWQQFTVGTARILGTVYTNTGAKPLAISFDSNGNTSGNAVLTIGGLAVGSSGGDTTNGATHSQIFGIVPPGVTYSVTSSRATNNWYELR